MDHTNLISPSRKTTPILTFPRRTGEGTELLIRQRGRLKPIFQTTSFLFHCYFNNVLPQPQPASCKKPASSAVSSAIISSSLVGTTKTAGLEPVGLMMPELP